MFTTPAVAGTNTHGAPRVGRGVRPNHPRSRVRDLPGTFGELPAVCLAEEIETTGPGQVRALVCVAGNPVLSLPNGGRLDAALGSLELMVSVDVYLNETSRHADVILPSPSALEKPHYDVALLQLAVRNIANWSEPVLPLPDGQLDEWEVLARLALIAQGAGAICRPRGRRRPRHRNADRCRRRRRTRTAARAQRRGAARRPCAANRSGADHRLLPAQRAVRGPLRRQPVGAHTRCPDRSPARHRPRSVGAAPAGRPAHSDGDDRGRSATDPRRPATDGSGAAAGRHRVRARRSPRPALEQLVDAQRRGARQGQAALPAPRPSRRRRRRSGSPTAGRPR